ncbi:hypothetical protein [Anaerobacillus alkalilacustris]|nr:hypothetical protein [Anaerobacillus alkalilacustris]
MDYFEAALLFSKRSGTGAAARDQGAYAFLDDSKKTPFLNG